jgi:hypothetical protein
MQAEENAEKQANKKKRKKDILAERERPDIRI